MAFKINSIKEDNQKKKSKPQLMTEKQHKGKKCGFFSRREELHDSSLDLLPNNRQHTLKSHFWHIYKSVKSVSRQTETWFCPKSEDKI